jgi:peptide/nickel transport system substrate-binding protein
MKKRINNILLLVLILMVIGFAAGCAGGEEQTQRPEEELILAIGGEPEDGFDPTTGWGRYGSPLFQSTLLTRDNNLNITGDLAEEYHISKDGRTWTFYLRSDVLFSDGEPLTAGDVVYTYETAASSGSVVDLNIMESAQAIDEYTVQIHLKKPQSSFSTIAASLGIVPSYAHGPDYSSNPVGSGPYRFVQWDKGQQLIVEANPEYYGEKPFFQKLTFLYLNEEAAFGAAKSGQADIVSIAPHLASQQVKGMKILSVPSVDNRGISFPQTKAGRFTEDGAPIGNDVTSDIAIRKAINTAIDRQALVDGILLGYGSEAYSVCDGLPWWNKDTVFEDGRIEEAASILSEAGWVDEDQDGILEKDGIKAEFNLVYPAGDSIRQSLALAVSDQMAPLGIKINLAGLSWDEIEARMYSDAVLFGWGSHDPLEMYNLYHSSTAGTGYYNTTYYQNPTADGYMESALRASTEEEALEYWKKAQWDGESGFSSRGDVVWSWLVNLKHVYLVSEKLDLGQNRIEPHGHGWPLTANVQEWKRAEQ